MNDMIKKIISTNEKDLIKRKSEQSITDLKKQIFYMPNALDFYRAFSPPAGGGIIAEIKLASPSAGELEKAKNVLGMAGEYKKGGANTISVITEKYFFNGDLGFIKQIKEKTNIPILQKDFVVDPYQIYESRVKGADALLLIAKIISPDQLKKFVELCFEVGVEPVVEISDELDLENALNTNAKVISVNARDLNTFKIDIEKACKILKKVPEKYLKLAFSGVNSKEEVDKYLAFGANGVLIGTNLIKSKNRVEFLKGLR